MLAIISCGNPGEGDAVEVLVVLVDAEEDWLLSCEEAALVEAVELWLDTCCVTVTVEVFVTVGVVVCASAGDGGFAGEKSDFTTEATPTTIDTMPKVRPALSRFLRVMLRSAGEAPFDGAPSFFDSSSTAAMVFSSHLFVWISTRR